MAVADGARESAVPSMVRAGPPGERVFPLPIRNWEAELAVMWEPWKVRTAADRVEAAGWRLVCGFDAKEMVEDTIMGAVTPGAVDTVEARPVEAGSMTV